MRLREALQRSSHAAPVTESETERPVKPAAPSTMKPVAALCTAMLMLVMFIPGGQGHELVPPWQQLFMPGSTTFVAAIFGFFILSLQFRAMDDAARARWFVIIGGLLLFFGFLVAEAAVAGDQFAGQPAVAVILAGGIAPAISLTLGVVPLLGALFWRIRDAGGRASKMALGVGALLCAFMYLAGDFVGLGPDTPLVIGLESLEHAPYLGDRLASGLALVPLLLCALTPLTLVEWRHSQRVHLYAALIFWLSVVVPGVVLALFVARAEWWFWVLEPLKVILTLSAGMLLLSLGIGNALASVEQDKELETS